MNFFQRLLRRFGNGLPPAPMVPPSPEPLPDNWLTAPDIDLKRLSIAQLDQKAAYHEAEAKRLEELANHEEAESLQRQALLLTELGALEAQQLDLQIDEQRLRGAHLHAHWVDNLCLLYGEEVGTKLANHQIEPGMTQAQLLYTYGVPEAENILVEGNRTLYRYGKDERGAFFVLVNNIITEVAIVTPPPYPPHAFSEYEEPGFFKD